MGAKRAPSSPTESDPLDGDDGADADPTSASPGLPVLAPPDGDPPLPATPPKLPPAPDPIEPREYVEIRPAKTTVDPIAVERAMDGLFALLEAATDDGLRARLSGSTRRPVVEWMVVSDGRADPAVRYLVGTSADDRLEDVTSVLRTCFPNGYEFRTVEWHPAYAREYLWSHDAERDGRTDAPSEVGGPRFTREGGVDEHPGSEAHVAAVEYCGRPVLRRDWQTPLTSFDAFLTGPPQESTRHRERSTRIPLAGLLETLGEAATPVVYQVVCHPARDWSSARTAYLQDLREGTVSLLDTALEALSPRTSEDRRAYEPSHEDRERIDGIRARDPRRSFAVFARAVVLSGRSSAQADTVANQLASALGQLGGPFHTIEGVVRGARSKQGWLGRQPTGSTVFEAVCAREPAALAYETRRLPWRSRRSAGVLITAEELAGFCLLDGARLTAGGERMLATRQTERTAVTLPPPAQLARYRPPGMALCVPLTHDRLPYGRPFYLPPSEQNRHQVIAGDTGAGKSTLTISAAVSNHEATAGATIIPDTKGGGTAEEYLRAHYARFGNLDDVCYFDLTEVLPAISFFDIRPLLEAGIPREEARSRIAGHYEEILMGVMGAERYSRATESPKVIRNHLKALFDPVHGADVVSHADLYQLLRTTHEEATAPSVSDDRLVQYFANLVERDRDVFEKVMSGALGRVDEIATDARLAPLFEHVPDESSPHFDFSQVIDEDCVVVFDFGGMEPAVKRTLTLVLLSNLWTALKAREDRSEVVPLVNLYLEEAADVAATSLVDSLLSQGRSFNLGVLLGVQFLAQLETRDPDKETYQEALNETATFVVGNVAVDDDLPKVFATDDMPERAVQHRLTAMRRGEWFVRPGTGFGEPSVRPFLARSIPAPPGHPASEQPLTGARERAFSAAFTALRERTRETAALSPHEPATVEGDDADAADEDAEATAAELATGARVDSLLPYTQRLPGCVTYDEAIHALCCGRCANRYDASIEGMIRAIECCHSLERVDPDDVPICECNLKLSAAEIGASEWSLRQLLFLQAVYNAQQLRYHPLEYDLLTTSMIRIQEYVGIDAEDIQALLDADLLQHDTDRPHRLYSVRPEGRSVIGESYRRGVDYGHGKGDLDESTEHVLGVEALRCWLLETRVADPESVVDSIETYYEFSEGSLPASAYMGGDAEAVEEAVSEFDRHRLDVVGLDADGDIVLVAEVERVNHDVRRAAPADYDKMAACEAGEAIWVATSHSEAHKILQALNDPLEGDPRVEKTYSESSPANKFRIDEPGFTKMLTIEQVLADVASSDSQ